MITAIFLHSVLWGFLCAEYASEDRYARYHYRDRSFSKLPEVNSVLNSPVELQSLRAINNVDAQLLTLPYMASVQVYASNPTLGWYHLCTAAIVDRNKLVTAAYPILFFPLYYEYRVVVGLTDLNVTPVPDKQAFKVLTFVPPPDFTTNGTIFGGSILYGGDIAVILLEEPIKFGANVKAVKLANLDSTIPSDCVVSGWEPASNLTLIPTVFVQAKINFVNFTECLAIYPYTGIAVTTNGVCLRDDPSDDVIPATCNRDFGGPLMCDKDYKSLYGVATLLANCLDGKPVVFTKVAPFADWIKSI